MSDSEAPLSPTSACLEQALASKARIDALLKENEAEKASIEQHNESALIINLLEDALSTAKMSTPAQQDGDAAVLPVAPAEGVPSPAQQSTPAVTDAFGRRPTATPDPTPRTGSSSQSPVAARGIYVPQFSAATQMLLKRIKKNEAPGQAPGLSAVKSPQPQIKSEFNPSTYEDVKRRVIEGMSTSSTMALSMPAAPRPTPFPPPSAYTSTLSHIPMAPAPAPSPATAPVRAKMANGAAGMSAIRRVTLGLTASGRPIAPKSVRPSTPAPAEPKEKNVRAPWGSKSGLKRKRGAPKGQNDENSSLSSLSDVSDNEAAAQDKPATPSAPLILTKSGRHIQKPTTYNPAEMESQGGKKRVHYSKVRTTEQALCKKCTRMHSPASNQMVFCDGCNEGWHQMCHEPWIDDAVVRDTNKAWYCAACQAKRDRHYATNVANNHPPKRQKVVAVMESWADRAPQQKRAFLSTLPQQELVGLLMHSLEIHPDLPIFPGTSDNTTAPSTPGTPQTPSDVHTSGRKGARSQKGTKGLPAPHQQQPDNEEEVDPLEPPWPKPGHGLYSLLPPEEDDECLVDDNDFESFSVIVYDERGRKIEENGIKVVGS